MNSEIRKILESVQRGDVSVDDALLAIKKEPFEDIGYRTALVPVCVLYFPYNARRSASILLRGASGKDER